MSHPLQFFVDFITKKGFNGFREDFFNRDKRGYNYTEDLINETITHEVPNEDDNGCSVETIDFKIELEKKLMIETNHCISFFDKIIFSQSIKSEREDYISLIIKETDKLIDDLNHFTEARSYPVIVESLERIKSHLSELNANSPYWGSEKIKTNLTVSELAFLFRIFVENKNIVQSKVREDFYRQIANNFSTEKAPKVSPDSIKNKFLTPELSAIENIITLFTQGMQTAKKYRDNFGK